MSSYDDQPGSKWSIFRETMGTFIGVAPYVVAVVLWGSTINERIRVLELRADHIETALNRVDAIAAEQRKEIYSKLERIGVQIETLQQTVARGSR